jgi:Putative zinc-finger
MDHESSIKTQAAEKYLLGELPPAEREAFEQHFFECAECASEVRLGFQFSENARAVFQDDPHRTAARAPQRPEWFSWFSRILQRPMALAPVAAAALALVALVGYQNLAVIPALRAKVAHLEQPQVLMATVLTPAARSALPSIRIPRDAQFFELSLVTAAIPPAERYRCEFRSKDWKLLATVPLPRLESDSNVTMLVPAVDFSNGFYEAVLIGVSRGMSIELDHYRFAVRRD